MSATAATTARPLNATIAWATRDGIYCEIPCKGGPPYITRYPLTREGLQSALNALIETPETAPRTVSPTHPAIKRVKPVFDEVERQGVRDVLKALKIV